MNDVLVVYKKSFFEIYSSSPDKEVRDFVKKKDEDAERMRKSHDEQQRTLETVLDVLDRAKIKHKEAYRADMGTIAGEVEDNDLVLSVGGDGTFLEVSHYVTKVPILGVNSDTNGSVGFFSTANRYNFENILREIGKIPKTQLSRLELALDGKRIPELVLNDIMVAHVVPAAGTSYRIWADGERYNHPPKNGGLVVCTAAGSTALMWEIGGEVMPLSSKQMQYKVRDKRHEKSRFADELKVKSLTREGKLYVDGQHIVYEFGLGKILDVGKGTPLTVVGDLEAKRAAYR